MNSLQLYEKVVARDLVLKLAFKNATQCPKLVQADLSLSNKLINAEKLILLPYFLALLLVAGQKPSVIRAKKICSNFSFEKRCTFWLLCYVKKKKFKSIFFEILSHPFSKSPKTDSYQFCKFSKK